MGGADKKARIKKQRGSGIMRIMIFFVQFCKINIFLDRFFFLKEELLEGRMLFQKSRGKKVLNRGSGDYDY